MTKALRIPLDTKLEEVRDLPYTVNYVMRKRMQYDNLNELPKEKRPTLKMMWEGTSEDIDRWLERVLGSNEKPETDIVIDTIEG